MLRRLEVETLFDRKDNIESRHMHLRLAITILFLCVAAPAISGSIAGASRRRKRSRSAAAKIEQAYRIASPTISTPNCTGTAASCKIGPGQLGCNLLYFLRFTA
jgi:hypothetical protein